MEDTESQKSITAPVVNSIAALHSVDYKGRPIDHAKTGRWKAASFLLVAEVLERFAYYGIASNLVTYLTSVLHQGTVKSTTNVFNWEGSTWVTPLLGAFIADAYLGRFATLVWFDVPYLVGVICLTLSVALPQLRPPQCATGTTTCTVTASKGELGFFWFALYSISFALAGVKPCLVTFAADQFHEGFPVERKEKYSFFNWFYYGIEVGAILAQTALVYIQENVGWGWGYGILTIVFFMSFVVTLVGTPFYRHQKLPKYSPFTSFFQVCVAAFRNRRLVLPNDYVSQLYEETIGATTSADIHVERRNHQHVQHTADFSFLDKAAMFPVPLTTKIGSSTLSLEKVPNPWRVCTVTQVEEVKQVLRVMPIWLSNTIVGITYPALVTTYFTKQGRTMDRHIGPHFKIPPASLQGFITLFLLILIPIYDRVLVPFFRRITGDERGITILKRMGVGTFFSSVACMVAACIEKKRLNVAQDSGFLDTPTKALPMTIFWLLPQYLMISLSEVFFSISTFDFYYTQFSPRLRALSQAMRLASMGTGLYWSTTITDAVVTITSRNKGRSWIVNNINRCRLDKFYWLCTVIMAINFCFFSVISSRYRYKDDDYIASSSRFHDVDLTNLENKTQID